MDHKPDAKVFQSLQHRLGPFRKAVLDPRPCVFLLHRRIRLHFRNLNRYRAVVHLIVIGTDLRLHAFQFIPHLRQAIFDGDQFLDRLRFLHKIKKSCLFLLKSLFMTLQVYIGKRYILYIFGFIGHIGLVRHGVQKSIQICRRDPNRHVGFTPLVVSVRICIVVGAGVFDIATVFRHLSLNVRQQLIVVFRLHIHGNRADQLAVSPLCRFLHLLRSVVSTCCFGIRCFVSHLLFIGVTFRSRICHIIGSTSHGVFGHIARTASGERKHADQCK